jgi:degradative hydroxymethylglutaryl-CoA reductase
VLGLPLGLGIHLVVDTVPYVIPMAIEEPSVVAALSNGARTLSLYGGGVYTEGHEKTIMEGMIRFINVPDEDWAERALLDDKDAWIRRANEFCPSMLKHGGGVLDITVRRFHGRSGKRYFVVTIAIDVCESMGTNCTTNVVENLAPLLQQTLRGEPLLAIVGDLSLHCVVRAKFRIPTRHLGYKGVDGYLMAQRIVDANEWAEDDIFRATTQNKGIMNGIDALALATGQDWRAIEASVHAYQMATKGYYGSLTNYTIQSSDNDDRDPYLEGSIELPMIVGTKGGVLSSNPCYAYAMRLLDYPDSARFARVSIP